MASPRTIVRADLALIGFGHVARRFISLLEERRETLERTCDLHCRVVAIVTRRHGGIWNPDGVDTVKAHRVATSDGCLTELVHGGTSPVADSFEAIDRLTGSDAWLRVVIETTTLDIRAGQPAIDHVVAALERGCHVVTANKGPAAFAYDDLRRRADAAGVAFL